MPTDRYIDLLKQGFMKPAKSKRVKLLFHNGEIRCEHIGTVDNHD